MKITRWMNWFCLSSKPNAVEPYYPTIPFSLMAEKLVDIINGES